MIFAENRSLLPTTQHKDFVLVAAIRQAELRVQAYTQPIMVVGSKYLDGAIEEKMAASSFWLL